MADSTLGMDSRRKAGAAGRGRTPLFATALAAACSLASPASAQVGSQLYLAAGQGLYASDDFCIGPEFFLSSFRLGFTTSAIGLSVAYLNYDWPWPTPPPLLQGEAFRHGRAFQGVFEVHPLRLFNVGGSAAAEYVQPFLGFGFQVAGDGEPGTGEGPGGVDVNGIVGRTDPIFSAGASARLQLESLPFGFHVQYRFTHLFGEDFEWERPDGTVVTLEGTQGLDWGEITAGFTLPIGE